MSAVEKRRGELEKAARMIRGEIADGIPSGGWSRPELEAMLSEICGEAEALTEDNADSGRRWVQADD